MTTSRPATWLPDPLDDALLRYWDGLHWTFHTVERRVELAPVVEVVPQPVVPVLRPDVAQALERVRGMLVGSMKEVGLLGGHLGSEERVLALTSARGEGTGVLACTDQRLVFLFDGLLRKQFLHVHWNQAKAVVYDQNTRVFAVYTTRPAKRAVPALAVRVGNLSDAQAVAHAAQHASAAPRLDIV
ncbi:DUF2510 domain-containing protein [Umezawaea sp. Da 62-37]|uniref:DUF2510 domain-containing protein n=1 Tax=Umezawaea sp. Da 62-37 TaxID=3075927 RepID=UPI0028F6CB2F|nr:DUF2510 domain-containing protein [Umezawaea sp. Da 62-37]WNV87263.1 DUF2510 domain-containing protein [Umezawaea sp. Da 62-37]